MFPVGPCRPLQGHDIIPKVREGHADSLPCRSARAVLALAVHVTRYAPRAGSGRPPSGTCGTEPTASRDHRAELPKPRGHGFKRRAVVHPAATFLSGTWEFSDPRRSSPPSPAFSPPPTPWLDVLEPLEMLRLFVKGTLGGTHSLARVPPSHRQGTARPRATGRPYRPYLAM